MKSTEYELEVKSIGKPEPWFDAHGKMYFSTKIKYALKGKTLLVSPFQLTIKTTNETGKFPEEKLPNIKITLTGNTATNTVKEKGDFGQTK